MQSTTSIQELFDIYAAVLISQSVAPWDDADEKRAFFCGFNACLKLIDAMAVNLYASPEKQETAIEGLHAEFERFAVQIDFHISTNH